MTRLLALAASASLLALASCGDGTTNAQDAATAEPAEASVEAAPAQTFSLTPIVEELEQPWGMAFLPNRNMLVTEREGRINLVTPSGAKTVISGAPDALIERQGGYFDVILDPAFASNRTIYLSYAKGTSTENSTSVFKAVLSADGTALENGVDIWAADLRGTSFHFGGRMQFMADGTLLLTLGDAFRLMQEAQSNKNTHGTIVRINTDGSIPADNPFVGVDGASEAVFTIGHRSVQGLYVDPDNGRIWSHEHGPKGGDELNVLHAGRNYGWPAITYGIGYRDEVISEFTEKDGMEQPYVKWVPSIAPSGMTKYTGDKYTGWTGDLIIGAMEGPAGLKLVRIDLDADGNVVGEHHYLEDTERPYRDVVQGPDGYIYLLTKELDGGVYRLDVN